MTPREINARLDVLESLPHPDILEIRRLKKRFQEAVDDHLGTTPKPKRGQLPARDWHDLVNGIRGLLGLGHLYGPESRTPGLEEVDPREVWGDHR